MNRIFAFDALRFMLALAIVFFHVKVDGVRLLPQGYLAVEIFFVLSGFLLAKSYCKYKDSIKDKLTLFKTMLINKLRRIYPEYMFFTVLVALIYYFVLKDNRFPDLFYNIILFGESGIAQNIVDGSWFVSALFWVCFLFIGLMAWLKKTFFYIVAPLLFLVCVVSLFNANQSSLMQIKELIYPFVSAGILRAIAAMSVGTILYYIYEKYASELKTNKYLILLGGLGVISGIEIFYLMMNMPSKLLPYNIYFFTFLFILALLVFNEYLKKLFNRDFWSYLGDLSYTIFLTNILVFKVVKKIIPYNASFDITLYLVLVGMVCLIFAVFLHGLYNYISRRIKHLWFTQKQDTEKLLYSLIFVVAFIICGALVYTHSHKEVIDTPLYYNDEISSTIHIDDGTVISKNFEIKHKSQIKYLKCRFFTWKNKFDNNLIVEIHHGEDVVKSVVVNLNEIKDNDIYMIDLSESVNPGKYSLIIKLDKQIQQSFAISVIKTRKSGLYYINGEKVLVNNDIQCVLKTRE